MRDVQACWTLYLCCSSPPPLHHLLLILLSDELQLTQVLLHTHTHTVTCTWKTKVQLLVSCLLPAVPPSSCPEVYLVPLPASCGAPLYRDADPDVREERWRASVCRTFARRRHVSLGSYQLLLGSQPVLVGLVSPLQVLVTSRSHADTHKHTHYDTNATSADLEEENFAFSLRGETRRDQMSADT